MMKMKVLSGIFFAVLLLFLLPAYTLAEPDMPFHDLIVQLDPEGSALTGVSTISLPPGKTARINLSGIKVRGILLHNRPLAVDPGTESLTFTPGSSADVLKIEFEAAYPALFPNVSKDNFRKNSRRVDKRDSPYLYYTQDKPFDRTLMALETLRVLLSYVPY